MSIARKINCPDCGLGVTLLPVGGQTYEQLYRDAAIMHERKGCQHRGYSAWGFDPAWDGPHVPKTIRHSGKLKIVQHPDGYMFSISADWSQDDVDFYIERTRTKRRA